VFVLMCSIAYSYRNWRLSFPTCPSVCIGQSNVMPSQQRRVVSLITAAKALTAMMSEAGACPPQFSNPKFLTTRALSLADRTLFAVSGVAGVLASTALASSATCSSGKIHCAAGGAAGHACCAHALAAHTQCWTP
jgi:hypothetical protein